MSRDKDYLQQVQWLATHMTVGQRKKSYELRLTDFGKPKVCGKLTEIFAVVDVKLHSV